MDIILFIRIHVHRVMLNIVFLNLQQVQKLTSLLDTAVVNA